MGIIKVCKPFIEKLHDTATECHSPYGITQCYLLPDTSERTPPECMRLMRVARGPQGRERGRVLREGEGFSLQLGIWGRCRLPHRGRGGAPESFEFGAFWDLKTASKLCNAAMKLYIGLFISLFTIRKQ